MQPVTQPEILNPDRVVAEDGGDLSADDHRARAQELDRALHLSCEYAQQLWATLDSMRSYLAGSLPPETAEDSSRTGASPTGPDDDAGWDQWVDAYTAVTSALAGPHGDSGFGAEEANRLSHARRNG